MGIILMKRVGSGEGGHPPKIVCISKVEGGGKWCFQLGFHRERMKEITRKSDLGKESVSPLSQAQRCQAGRHWPRAGGHGLFRPGDLPRCTVCPCLVTNPLPPKKASLPLPGA